jgi:CRP-like cAMP-binding protein
VSNSEAGRASPERPEATLTGGLESGFARDPARQDAAQPNAAGVSGSPSGTPGAPQQPVDFTDYRPVRSPQVTTVPFVTRHGEPYYILANRDQAKYLRLAPDEHHLWTLMDGTRTVKDLIYEYFTAFKTFAFEQVAQFVAQLRRSYMLADPPEDAFASGQRTPSNRWGQAWPRAVWEVITGRRTFQLRHIDGLMGALHRRGGWILYTTPLQMLYVAFAVVGGALFLRHLVSGRYDLFQVAGSYGLGLLLLIGLNTICLIVHEASHAFTCKHYGARVNSAGLMLYFGLPAAFVDTTDVWTKPASARIATTWAGPYSGAILAGLGAVVVQAMPGSWVAPILHRLSFLWLENLLFNVIPFLELDGYFLAVDWLEIPLLRAKALAFVRRDLWDRLRRRQPLTGRERLLARFGVLSILFSGLVLVSAILFWEYRLKALARTMWAGGVGSKALLVLLLVLVGFPLVAQGVAQARAMARSALAWVRRRRVPHGRALRERETLLRQVQCLSGLSAEEVTQVATRMGHHLFRPGRIVVREGTPPDRFYLIEHGVAEVWVDDELRPRRRLVRGDYFGETSLRQRLPHAATVRAGSWLSVFAVRPGDFQRLVAPHLCAQVVDRLSALQALRRFSVLADHTARELDALMPRLQRKRYPPGAVVYAKGNPAEALYLVDSGQAEVQDDGEPRRILRSGDSFGEVALLRHVPQPETVRALTPLEVLVLPSSDFESLVAPAPHQVTTVGRDIHGDGLGHVCGPAAASRSRGG